MASFFKGKKAKTVVDPYGTWNPEQKTLGITTGKYLTSMIGKETPQYEGDFTAEIGPDEQASIDNSARLAAMTGNWENAFRPGEVNEDVAKTYIDALNREFYGDALTPGAKALAEEQFAGTGGYWGDARARGVLGTYKQTVTDPYNLWRANAIQNSYANALNYAKTASDLNVANQTAQATSRLIRQYGLDKKYTEWVRTRPESQQYINDALTFLNLSTVTREYIPGQQSGFQALAKSGILGIGGGIAADATSGTGDWTATEGSSQAMMDLLKSSGQFPGMGG